MDILILTRYLYSFIDARQSLFLNILDGNHEEALYWAYELYWSGFTGCTFEHLLETYDMMFITDEMIKERMRGEYNKWRLDNSLYENLGTIVINLCFQSYRISKFVDKFFKIKCNDMINGRESSNLYININKKDVEKYSINYDDEKRYKILGMEYKYNLRTEYSKIFQLTEIDIVERREELLSNWEYYAYKCPYWREAIDKYEGVIDNNKIVFKSDDNHEKFYEKYSLEIEEQSSKIIDIALGITVGGQKTMKEFIQKYNGKLLIKKKRNVIIEEA
jgi:hypothetical protein